MVTGKNTRIQEYNIFPQKETIQITQNIDKDHIVNKTISISKHHKNIPKSHKYISMLSNWISKEKFFLSIKELLDE